MMHKYKLRNNVVDAMEELFKLREKEEIGWKTLELPLSYVLPTDYDRLNEMIDILNEQCSGDYVFSNYTLQICFEKDEDYVHFSLKWL